MGKSSQEYKEDIKKKLNDISYNIENMYDSIEEELRKEFLIKKEKNEIIDKKTNDTFKKLDYDICEKIIKDNLPLNVKLFNKIKANGYGIKGRGSIIIQFSLGDDYSHILSMTFGTKYIEKYL